MTYRGGVWISKRTSEFFTYAVFAVSIFGEDQAAYADFPKYEKADRRIMRMALQDGSSSDAMEVEEQGRECWEISC